MIQLTLFDRGRPLLDINPHHIVSVQPRKVVRPNPATQEPDLKLIYEGAVVQLSTGAHHNVCEQREEVLALMAPFVGPGPIPQPSVPGLDTVLSQTANLSAQPVDVEQLRREGQYPADVAPPPPGDEPPAGTPLTEEELAEVAKHDAIPDEERSPQPGTPAPAKKAPAKKAAPKAPEAKTDDDATE